MKVTKQLLDSLKELKNSDVTARLLRKYYATRKRN